MKNEHCLRGTCPWWGQYHIWKQHAINKKSSHSFYVLQFGSVVHIVKYVQLMNKKTYRRHTISQKLLVDQRLAPKKAIFHYSLWVEPALTRAALKLMRCWSRGALAPPNRLMRVGETRLRWAKLKWKRQNENFRVQINSKICGFSLTHQSYTRLQWF